VHDPKRSANLQIARYGDAGRGLTARAPNGANTSRTPNATQLAANMDRIYRDWDKPLSENDAEGLLKLYAENPIIESPLIPHLLGKEEVVCCGYKEMRPFFEAVAKWQNESLHFVSISELAI